MMNAKKNSELTDNQKKYMRLQAKKQADKGICDPIYKATIDEMLEQQRDDPMPTGLVVINSFDYQLDDIREEMIDRKIYADVFEIDRLQKDSRQEYLNCFQEMFSTKELPMIFMKDKFIGNYQDLQSHFSSMASQQM